MKNFKYECMGAIGGLFACLLPVMADARPLLLSPERASAMHGDSAVEVRQGGALAISFLNTSERIYKVWFAKPSKIQVEGDVPICASTSCPSAGASVLYLRFPAGTDFAGQVVTLATADGDRRNLYNFRLVPSRNPHSVVAISPRAASAAPVLESVFANPRIERGLSRAKERNLVEPELEARVRQFLQVFDGSNLELALAESGLSLETIRKLHGLARF